MVSVCVMAAQTESVIECMETGLAGKYREVIYCITADLLNVFLYNQQLKVICNTFKRRNTY